MAGFGNLVCENSQRRVAFRSTTEVAICRSGMYLVVTVLPGRASPALDAIADVVRLSDGNDTWRNETAAGAAVPQSL